MRKILVTIITALAVNLGFTQTNNYSVDFNGIDDYINIPTSIDFDAINSAMTVTAWIKPDSTSSGASPRIIDRSEGDGGGVDRWLFTWSPTGEGLFIGFAVGSTGTEAVFGATPIIINEWTYISAVFDAGNVSIYINGELDGSGIISFTDLLHVQDVDINIASVNGNNSFFPGLIDEITLWGTALDSLTIQQYMHCPPNGDEPGLIGYWRFEEGAGTMTEDQSINDNDGILSGGPTWSEDTPPYLCCDENLITTQPSDQIVYIGNDAIFDFTDSLTLGAYQWQMDAGLGYTNLSNAGQFSGTDTKTLTVSSVTLINDNSNYRCLVTDTLGCVDTTDIVNLAVLSGIGIKENENSTNEISIYPNPSSDQITIQVDGNFEYKLLSLSGETIIVGQATDKTDIDVRNCARGQYIIEIDYQNKKETIPFFKQ